MTRLTRFSLAAVVANLGVILWGAYVRASGSGAGCGSHWPLCNGEVLPRSPAVETVIELTHRLTSGIALVLVVILVVAAFRSRPAGDPTRPGAVVVLLFMLAEAGLGAGLVLFELVADDDSMARAGVMSFHLVNTLFLLAALALTTSWSAGGPRLRLRGRGRIGWVLIAAAGGLLLVGASGAISALGDTLFPAATLGEALRQDLSPTAHLLIRLRVLHPLIAVAVGLLLLSLPGRVSRHLQARPGQRWAHAVSFLVLAQFAVGVTNVALLAPTWLQLVHLLLADLLWMAFVLYAAAVTDAPEWARLQSEKKGLDQAQPPSS